jgi:hypothetical protein
VLLTFEARKQSSAGGSVQIYQERYAFVASSVLLFTYSNEFKCFGFRESIFPAISERTGNAYLFQV